MRIRRLYLQSFGCLSGEYRFSADRANLALEPNETGKSTLAAAILAALYGFPPGQRRSESHPIVEAELYRPWKGDPYVVEMDVEVAGDLYTVRRDFAARREQVFEGRSGKEITERFQTSKDHLDFAGSLTGLDREDFSRTAFLRQSEMARIRNASGITAALQKMASSQEGDVAASEAMEILSDALRQFRGQKVRRGKIDTEIAGIEEEIRVLRAKIGEMESRRGEVEGRIRELEGAAQEEESLDSRLDRLEYLIIAAGRAEDQKRLDEELREKQELESREAEFQSLGKYAAFPSEKRGRLAELKARVEALGEEERRLSERRREDVEDPLSLKEALAKEREGLGRIAAEDLSRYSGLESDLAASWKTARAARRSLHRLSRGLRARGEDPERLLDLTRRISALTPDQRRFLLDYGASEAECRRLLAQSEHEADDAREALAEMESRSGKSRAAGRWLLAGAAAAGLAAVALWIFSSGILAIGSGLLALILAGARFAAALSKAANPEVDALRKASSLHEQGRTEWTEAIADLRRRLEALAAESGAGDADAFLREFRESEEKGEEAREVSALEKTLRESREAYERSAASIRALMDAAEYAPRGGLVTPSTARRFREALSAHGVLLREIAGLGERKAAHDRDLDKLASEREAITGEMRALLEEAGLDASTEVTEAEARFEEAMRARERYELLRKEIIPDLVRRSLSRQDKSLARQIEAQGAILERMRGEKPGLADLAPEKSHKEYVEERNTLQKRSKEAAGRRLELANELSEVLREYRRDTPDAQRWLGEWEEQLARVTAFRSAVEMAHGVLEELSRESYAEWADVLNERASEALAYLVPGYHDLRFDETLAFNLRENATGERRGQEDIDLRFSGGTRDQIYLACRLALSGYLSSGRIRLPLILDDPFANFDDDRFTRAMNVLLDKYSRRHQVIILSCHEARHRAWQDRHPELFADRIRIMTLHAVTS